MTSIKELPEFASLCSFIQLFGEEINVSLSHNQLAKFLEVKDAENVPKIWIDIHRRLLSRIKYPCSIDKWEGALKKCLFSILGCDSELANLYGTNYFGITADNRAKILNILFDCQFDRNIKFKEKVNLRFISDLRSQPFGSDIHGCVYWLFVDSDVSIIMYKENLEEESFKIVAESIDELHKLQNELNEINCENTILSKLYLETSPSDEIDNSRNESPFTDYVAISSEKPALKTDSVKLENLQNTLCVTQDSENNHIEELKVKEELEENIKVENDITKMVEEDFSIEKMESTESIQEVLETVQENPKTLEIKEEKINEKEPENQPLENVDDSLVSAGLRRSERKRKPVNLFSINYSDSFKKIKYNSYEKEKKPKKEKMHKKSKEKRKKGRPRKHPEFSDTVSKEKKKMKKNKNKHKKKSTGHKKHKSKHPWEHPDSSEDLIEMEDEDDEDQYLNEESECSLSVKELWDDKPESDFDIDKMSVSSDEETSKARGRNYFRQKNIKTKKQEVDDRPCQICLRNNIPEMILLCDDCDLGHHAMCLRPSLMIIPEGDWYCPKCQHKKLIVKLTEKISELEKSLMKNVSKIRMQERLNYVNISMTNILTKNQDRRSNIRSKSLYVSSDIDSQSDCNSSSQSQSSSSESCDDDSSDNSSESDSKAPRMRYKFRETSRKENTKYNFEDIDKIFDDALEHDEKYKLLKKEQQVVKETKSENSPLEDVVESEPEYDYSGIEPRKKSSGKDMANIIDDEKKPTKISAKKKRLTFDSDNDDYEDDTKDVDFTISDQSDSEFDEYECIEGDVTNCSDDDWVVNKKKSVRRSGGGSKKKSIKSIYESGSVHSRPKRSATRNVNYRNMLADDDDEEDSAGNEQSPEYESSEDDNKPPPVVSRKKDKHTNRMKKKRIISDSEYEEDENSKSASVAESGSTEKQESVKHRNRLDLNSDSENDGNDNVNVAIIPTPPETTNENFKILDNLVKSAPVSSLEESIFSSLNPMRAKGDEDDDVENEVESETECNLRISLNDDLTGQNIVPRV